MNANKTQTVPGPKLAGVNGSGTVKYKHRVYQILVRVVRMLPIFCKTCDSMRVRHRYDMCRECWMEYCRLTREALWTDHEDAPPAPWPTNAQADPLHGRWKTQPEKQDAES